MNPCGPRRCWLAVLIAFAAFLVGSCPLYAQEPVPLPPLGPLPGTVEPKRYLLDLTVDPASTRFRGHVEIQAELTTAARSIFIHGQDLKVSRARASKGNEIFDVRYTEVGSSGVARLDFPLELSAGPLTLSFEYSAGIGTSADGLFHTKIADDWYAWTQLEPTSARRVFPGFDEPRFKTPFEITVRAPGTARVFSNAVETRVVDRAGLRIHRFAPTPPLPTYLVALGVGPFDVRSTTAPPNAVRSWPVPMRIIATQGQLPRMGVAAAETPKILALLEQYVGVAYPYEKLDFLASPTMGGAMENAGLIIVNDVFLLLDADSPASQLRGFAEVNTHEMAHQWFGDLVTPAWWTDVWLSESFAQWLGRKVADQWRPDLGIAASALEDVFSAMDADALGQGRSIRQPITDNSEITSAFDSITYEKGAQVLSMFESYLGARAFGEGVRRYLNSYRLRTASADDFFRSLSQAAGDSRVAPALQTFTDQTGVPVVGVEERGPEIVLTQARYRPLGIGAAPAQTWRIPVCLTRGALRDCSLLETSTSRVPRPEGDAALVPDAEGSGYFRFHMDAAGWSGIIAVAPELSARAALTVADSLWADFAAGAVGFDRILEGARSLSRNPNSLAATALGARLKHLADTELTDDEIVGYRALMSEIYAPKLAALGLDPSWGAHSHESVRAQSLRQTLVPIVALEGRDSRVRAQLLAAAVAYLRGDRRALDPSFRGTALKVAMQERGALIIGELKDTLLRSTDPLLREQIVAAIGSADTSAAARAALDIAWSPGIQTQESLRILMSLAGERGARESVIQFVELNFQRIMETLPAFARPFLLPTLFENYCSTADADRAEAFIRPKLVELGGGQLELAQARETIRLCASLREAKGSEIDAALRAAVSRRDALALAPAE